MIKLRFTVVLCVIVMQCDGNDNVNTVSCDTYVVSTSVVLA